MSGAQVRVDRGHSNWSSSSNTAGRCFGPIKLPSPAAQVERDGKHKSSWEEEEIEML